MCESLLTLDIGDDEKVRVWDVSTRRRTQMLDDHARRWGQITCLVWLDSFGRLEDGQRVLAFGTGRGLLVIYRQTREDVCFALTHFLSLIVSAGPNDRASNDPRFRYQ